jgi:hypothetical protein
MADKDKKVVYYVLGIAALATGVYFLSSNEQVKAQFNWLKNIFNVKKKFKDNDKD